jgi:CheY-like chemotaxis protein
VTDGKRARAAPARPASSRTVLLVGRERDWPEALKADLQAGGYVPGSIADLGEAPARLDQGIGALFVPARPLGATEVLALRRVREASPRTAIVVVATTPTDPDLKRAFESGATAFLSWPASRGVLRHALESGDLAPRSPGGQEDKKRT